MLTFLRSVSSPQQSLPNSPSSPRTRISLPQTSESVAPLRSHTWYGNFMWLQTHCRALHRRAVRRLQGWKWKEATQGQHTGPYLHCTSVMTRRAMSIASSVVCKQ